MQVEITYSNSSIKARPALKSVFQLPSDCQFSYVEVVPRIKLRVSQKHLTKDESCSD